MIEQYSKKDLTDHFCRMLRRHEVGAVIPEPDRSDLFWLIERHPEYERKRGAGIAEFTVVAAAYATHCFAICRIDGTSTDFSYRSCIAAPSIRSQVLGAMRAEVNDDIRAAKQLYFEKHADPFGRVRCALTGILVTIDQSHADHAPPRTFNELATGFLEARNLVADKNLITPSIDNQFCARLRDRSIAEEWRRYHHNRAHIRIVAAAANLSRNDGPRIEDRQLLLIGGAG